MVTQIDRQPELKSSPGVAFFFSSRRRHTRFDCDWSSDVCSSDLERFADTGLAARKDVGPSGVHAVIELATPAPLAERRAVERSVAERRLDAAPSDSRDRKSVV